MLIRIATAALAATLLGASAYALAPLEPAKGPVAGAGQTSGVTVIEKNSLWPLKEFMSMDPCTLVTCQEA